MKWTLPTLITAVGALVTLGVVILSSCAQVLPRGDFFLRQLLWLGFGLVACVIAASLDYRTLARPKVAGGLLLLAVGLLVLTLVPGIGTKVNGARRWLLGAQPSEFAKIALVVWLAHYCAAHLGQMRQRKPGFLVPMMCLGLVAGLVFLEPDWGTAVLLAAVGGIMIAIAGAHWGYLLAAAVMGAELFTLALCQDPERMMRVLSFLDPEVYKDGVGWQAWNALLALGCGGWMGEGLGEGRLKLGFIPEHHTDFILAVIGEELGLVGTGIVVLAFVLIVLCGLRISWRAPDAFGQLLASGLTFLIGVQAFINLGVATSSLPNKGIALPFVSYGGSNLVAMLTCIGLLISIARQEAASGVECSAAERAATAA
jgi:cell division protein FtsW